MIQIYRLPIQYKYNNGDYKMGFLEEEKNKDLFNVVDDQRGKVLEKIKLNDRFLYGDESIKNVFVKIDETDILNLIQQHCTKNDHGKDYYKGPLKYFGYLKNNKYDGKGTEYYKNGKVFFSGIFENNEKLQGKFYSTDQQYVLESKFPIVYGVPNINKPFVLENKFSNNVIELNQREKFVLVKVLKETNSLDDALESIGVKKKSKNEKITTCVTKELEMIKIILSLHLFLNFISLFIH